MTPSYTRPYQPQMFGGPDTNWEVITFNPPKRGFDLWFAVSDELTSSGCRSLSSARGIDCSRFCSLATNFGGRLSEYLKAVSFPECGVGFGVRRHRCCRIGRLASISMCFGQCVKVIIRRSCSNIAALEALCSELGIPASSPLCHLHSSQT